jgi:hypothetical protein
MTSRLRVIVGPGRDQPLLHIIYVGVNAIAPGRHSRTKEAISAVRHVSLEADHDARKCRRADGFSPKRAGPAQRHQGPITATIRSVAPSKCIARPCGVRTKPLARRTLRVKLARPAESGG